MRNSGEPSVEEILDSIKKVIARDNRAGAAVERREREARGMRSEPEPESVAFDDEADEDVLDLADGAELANADQHADRLADDEDESDTPILAEGTRQSMRESLAALAMLAQPGMPPQIVRSGETSLEGLARDLLRPALGEWLDKNLPGLVERMVATEIARIVGKKG